MSNPVKPIPEGYHSITPYLIIKGASEAIELYKSAFGATETMRLNTPEGKVGHAELKIGNSMIMLADECSEMGALSPQSIGGVGVMLHLYVEDVDKVAEQARTAGLKETRPVMDQFYGDRSGTFEDPYGHIWTVGTHIEDLTAEEINKRMEAMMSQKA